jgi:hypothetical protein
MSTWSLIGYKPKVVQVRVKSDADVRTFLNTGDGWASDWSRQPQLYLAPTVIIGTCSASFKMPA